MYFLYFNIPFTLLFLRIALFSASNHNCCSLKYKIFPSLIIIRDFHILNLFSTITYLFLLFLTFFFIGFTPFLIIFSLYILLFHFYLFILFLCLFFLLIRSVIIICLCPIIDLFDFMNFLFLLHRLLF